MGLHLVFEPIHVLRIIYIFHSLHYIHVNVREYKYVLARERLQRKKRSPLQQQHLEVKTKSRQGGESDLSGGLSLNTRRGSET